MCLNCWFYLKYRYFGYRFVSGGALLPVRELFGLVIRFALEFRTVLVMLTSVLFIV